MSRRWTMVLALSSLYACTGEDNAVPIDDGDLDDTSAADSADVDTAESDTDDSDTDDSDTDDSDTDDTDEDTDFSETDIEYGLSTHNLEHDDENREFLLYVPESYDGTEAVPIMMGFHGFGSRHQDHMRMADMRPLAESENFILVYPQGTRLDGFTHWNTYDPGGENKSDADDYGFVEVMLDTLSEDYNIDPSRVYASGFSNGGDFTYTLGCFLSDRVTAIASVSGLMWTETRNNCNANHPTAVLTLHGTRDNDRPYDGYPGYMMSIDEINEYWNDHNEITDAGSTTDFEDSGLTIERTDFTGGEGDVMVTHYKFVRGGHDWFDFEDEGEDTNSIIWNFVSQFDQNGMR